MNYALAGKIAVCFIVIGFAVAPFIGRYLARRRYEDELQAFHENQEPEWELEDYGMPAYLPRDPMKYEGRDLTDGQLFIVNKVPDNELSRELLQEQQEYNDRRRIPRPVSEFEYNAFALDPNDQPKRAS